MDSCPNLFWEGGGILFFQKYLLLKKSAIREKKAFTFLFFTLYFFGSFRVLSLIRLLVLYHTFPLTLSLPNWYFIDTLPLRISQHII